MGPGEGFYISLSDGSDVCWYTFHCNKYGSVFMMNLGGFLLAVKCTHVRVEVNKSLSMRISLLGWN
jgi:hypothetical protein